MGDNRPREHSQASHCRCEGYQCSVPRGTSQKTLHIYQKYHFNNDMPNGLTEQKRLSVYNRNPGPRRGKGGAIEKHFAVKWHIVTLQESIEYLEHEFLTNRFHVTHHGGCAILFNQDIFCSDVKVTSVHLHDLNTVKEGGSGWCYKVSYPRASFRCQPRGGKSLFTVLSLHINKSAASGRSYY